MSSAMIDQANGAWEDGGRGSGTASAIGLSEVHISPFVHGKWRDRDLGEVRYCNGGGIQEHVTALGRVTTGPLGDHWLSVRRWRGGISLGVGPCVEPAERKRGEVRAFSEGSSMRMLRYLEEAVAEYRYFGTLTVGSEFSADPADFRRAADRWLTWFLKRQQKREKEFNFDPARASVFWFVEFQARGAPHLHLFYTAPVHWRELAQKWDKICAKYRLKAPEDPEFWRTSTRFERFRSTYRGVISYARKYAAKQEQKQIPESYSWQGRWWGVRGCRARGSFHATTTTRSRAARELRELYKVLEQGVRDGLLRKFRWSYGEGAIYVPRKGEMRDLPSWMHAKIEVCLSMVATQITGQVCEVTNGIVEQLDG